MTRSYPGRKIDRYGSDESSSGRLSLRDQLEDAALRAVCHEVDRAVGALAYVAESLPIRLQILEQSLLAHDLVTLHRQAHQVGAAQAADEQTVLPRREDLPGVEEHAARRDVG